MISPDDEHPSLVVLQVENEDELLRESQRLRDVGILHSLFYEDDLLSHTALATRRVSKAERKLFREMSLL